ncbi:hypothetical protein PNOK_0145600 [Pyrrhoderma noxium]|uniref:Uncharacterized protein n=1 Tax=Pyrrhoderma noxium TaxID=2282107 RepID=A0A286UXV6_9AGAM|nr:hypothetical protein PNOK_0145600 [Pyrrhoderma noxium]
MSQLQSTSYTQDCPSNGNPAMTVALPNVFVTPPEEEYDNPPWCCFDADKDAQPGALIYEDLMHAQFDYSDHAEDEAYDGEIDSDVFGDVDAANAMDGMMDFEAQEDAFHMRDLMHETEDIHDRLNSLDLTISSRRHYNDPVSSVSERSFDKADVPTDVVMRPATPEQKITRSKSLFFFKTLGRKKSKEVISSVQTEVRTSNSQTSLHQVSSTESQADTVDIPRSPTPRSSRKFSFFSRFKFSSKKQQPPLETTPRPRLQSAPSPPTTNTSSEVDSHACRSFEALPTPRASTSQEVDAESTMKRRFSFFDLPRSRCSTSSQSTIPTIPTLGTSPNMESSMNQSTSSLGTTSVPLTPEGASSMLSSPPDTPVEACTNMKSISEETSASLIRSMESISVENLAASLSLPAHTYVPDDSFKLDPLHFDSLQFNSGAFS